MELAATAPMAISLAFSLVPLALTVAALVDAIRTGADWYWILFILYMPVIGALAYFGSRARGGIGLAPSFAGRTLVQARRTLRERQAQLHHWRGPGPLQEAGESLLVLGKYADAESHLREARERGAPIEDVGFALGLAIEAQRRGADAIPVLEELCAKEPDHQFGQARLALARCLDAAGRHADAERELRGLLERRSLVEARVRLVRLVFLRGDAEEGARLLAALRADAKTMPPFQRRRERRWLWAARTLGPGRTRLPASPTGRVRDFRPPLALAVGLASLVLAAPMLMTHWRFLGALAASQASRTRDVALERRLQELDRASAPAPRELSATELETYVQVRAELARALSKADGAADAGPARTQDAVAATAIPVLARHGIGRAWLRRACARVEWAFLRREAALPFALEPEEWVGWRADKEIVRAPPDPEEPGSERAVAEAAGRVERLDGVAAERRTLTDAERALLEGRRAELEALDATRLPALERLVFGR